MGGKASSLLLVVLILAPLTGCLHSGPRSVTIHVLNDHPGPVDVDVYFDGELVFSSSIPEPLDINTSGEFLLNASTLVVRATAPEQNFSSEDEFHLGPENHLIVSVGHERISLRMVDDNPQFM